ncbi:hypothetical protein LTR84_004289 [Exophiala bonariae]|uniref:Transcription factor domain-containing protein n=1 Tax=Exophiala bonariae TaxID=1690606 RepID=A0AAV9N488_9EURO|nr:hypothetical protein LTR84_004289 [Exophiala bonariae]
MEKGRDHNENPQVAENHSHCPPPTTINIWRQERWGLNHHGLTGHNLDPLMILPSIGSKEADAITFFEFVSIENLNHYQPSQSWRNMMMFFSQTVPSVRHAALALALLHRDFTDRGSPSSLHPPQSFGDYPPGHLPLVHYNRAIELLLDHDTGDNPERTAITLLVCYLLTCFDHLAGNYVQAIKHLRGGVDISCKMNNSILDKEDPDYDATHSSVSTVINQVTRQIRRLDLQAVTFLVDWIPTDTHDTIMSQSSPSDDVFQTLDQAADCLQILVNEVLRLHNTGQQFNGTSEMSASLFISRPIVLRQLEVWLNRFQNMVPRDTSHENDTDTGRLISLLRLKYGVAWIHLSSFGPGKEMEYDSFLTDFQQCASLADGIATAHERHPGSLKPTFTPEIGIVPMLYLIAVKCRHPVVRRQALGTLRRHPIREAVWDSICVARVVERVIDIEESGSQQAEQIALGQRIETLSWIHVENLPNPPRVDITYVFCGRGETHTESLKI